MILLLHHLYLEPAQPNFVEQYGFLIAIGAIIIFVYREEILDLLTNVYYNIQKHIAKKQKSEERIINTNNLCSKKQTHNTMVINELCFKSTKHVRYENGVQVGDEQICERLLEVKRNTSGCKGYILPNHVGYIVYGYNLDIKLPNGEYKPLFSAKPMKLINKTDTKAELRGYMVQAMTPWGYEDFDLSDYGLTIYYNGGVESHCVLHMFDRNIAIDYTVITPKSTENIWPSHTSTSIDNTTPNQNTKTNDTYNIKNYGTISFKKVDYQKYQQELTKNGIKYCYHFTDIRNIPTILKYGGLYSWCACKELGINIVFPGGDDFSKDLDYSKSLQDYVHLSLCNDHPMMHHVKQRGAHLVLLKISTHVATFTNTLFSDRNATDKNCHIGSTLSDLERINFPATQRQFIPREDDDFKFHQAEILVKRFIPIEYILNLEDVIKEVKDILPTQQNSAQTSSDTAHQSSLNATEAPNRDYQTYNKWSVIEVQKFTQEEIDLVDHATVVETSYGASCCFFMKNGHTLFIPMSTDAKAKIGDPVNMNEAEILTLHKHGENNIMRIRA